MTQEPMVVQSVTLLKSLVALIAALGVSKMPIPSILQDQIAYVVDTQDLDLNVVEKQFKTFLTFLSKENKAKIWTAINEGLISGIWPYLEYYPELGKSCGCLLAHVITENNEDSLERWRGVIAGRDRMRLGFIQLENFIIEVEAGQTSKESGVLAQLVEWYKEWETANA